MKDSKTIEKGFVVWLTGLPSSGKTTVARGLGEILKRKGLRVEILDGDEVRKKLSPDLGFSKKDREIHAKRVAYVSKLLSRNGVVVIVALISPYRAFREYARQEVKNFVEVFVKCPAQVCAKRDPKGLYEKAKRGEISDFTGVQDPYEEPENPEVLINTEIESADQCVKKIKDKLRELGYLTF